MGSYTSLLAGALLTLLVALSLSHALQPLVHQDETHLLADPQFEAVLVVDCQRARVEGDGFYYDMPARITASLRLLVSNPLDRDVYVWRAYPDGGSVDTPVSVFLRVDKGETGTATRSVNWLSLGGLVQPLRPGDEFELSGGELVKVEDGTIFEFHNASFPVYAPDWYAPPYTGGFSEELEKDPPDRISAVLRSKGHASTLVASVPLQYVENHLLLTFFYPREYQYPGYDVVFHIHETRAPTSWTPPPQSIEPRVLPPPGPIPPSPEPSPPSPVRTGAWLYALYDVSSGSGGYIEMRMKGGGSVERDLLEYGGYAVAVKIEGDTAHYYVNGREPNWTSATDGAGGSVFVGVGRTVDVESEIRMMLVLWNHGGQRFSFEGMWQEHETDYIYIVVDPDGGYTVRVWGPGYREGSFDSPDSWAEIVVDRSTYRSDVPPYLWVLEEDPPGPSSVDPWGRDHGGELVDLLLGWDDTQKGGVEEQFRITIFEDGWARIEHVRTVTGRDNPDDSIFIAYINRYAPSETGSDGWPVNWSHVWTLSGSDTVGSVYWTDLSNYIDFGAEPIVTSVPLVAAYKSEQMVVSGLLPGEKLLVLANGKVRVVNATEGTLSVDLLSLLGAKELAMAIASDNLYLAVRPSPARIFLALPSHVVVEYSAEGVHTVVRVPVRVENLCSPAAGVTGGDAVLAVSLEGVFMNVSIQAGGEEAPVGQFAKAAGSASNYRITVTYPNGTTITLEPGKPANVAGATVVPPDPASVLIMNGTIAIGQGYPALTLPAGASRIELAGTVELTLYPTG